jgi:hypothetical protein
MPPLQFNKEAYNIMKSCGFDMTLANKVFLQNQKISSMFFENLEYFNKTCLNKTKNKYMCGIKTTHLDFISSKIINDVFGAQNPNFIAPSKQDVLDAVNKRASIGLPNPFIKKRDYLDEIDAFLTLFLTEKLKITDLFEYPSATFVRLQIRTSGLKVRLINAVQARFQSLESYYYLYFTSGLPQSGSAITLGITQLGISKLISSYKGYYTYSIDHSKWDLHRQPSLGIISFEIILQCLPLSVYQKKILIGLRNYYLTMPSFHPSSSLVRRHIGTVSGSGFTSLDNSLCNLICMYILIYDYCNHKGLNPYEFIFKINVNGDDIVFGTKQKFDFQLFQKLAYNKFGITIRLEHPEVKPDIDEAFYLGSLWKEGKPYRPESQLVASMLFYRAYVPGMSIDEFIQSRFIEIFGNTSDILKYYDKFKRFKLRHRYYFYNELYRPFMSGVDKSDRNTLMSVSIQDRNKDPRGFWYNMKLQPDDLQYLWTYR